MIIRILDYLRKFQIPIMAAWLIWVGWTGDLGMTITTFDNWMGQLDAAMFRVAGYPSLFLVSVGIAISWVSYWLWLKWSDAMSKREPAAKP